VAQETFFKESNLEKKERFQLLATLIKSNCGFSFSLLNASALLFWQLNHVGQL